MLAITVMIAMQIHGGRGLAHGSLANPYFAHYELRSPRIERGSSRKALINKRGSTLRAA